MNVLIVSGLAEFGGVEKEVSLIAQVCADNGYSVDIISSNYISNDSYVKTTLNGKSIKISSIYEFYFQTLLGSICYLIAFFRFLVVHKKMPNALRKYGFCSSASKTYRKDFWIGNDGKNILNNSQLIILVGQPLNIYQPILKYAKKLNKNLVFRITGGIFKSHLKNHFYNEFIDQINYCTAMSVHSNKNKVLSQEILNYKGKIDIIDQYADNEDNLLDMDQYSTTKKSIHIGVLSRLSKEKKVDDIIKVISMLKDKYDIHLLIAGDGSEKSNLVELTQKLDLSSRVVFLGYIENKEKEEFFRTIDIFAITSETETGPITGVEAMAAGILTISTRVGAMPERLASVEPSLFYDLGDTEQLKEKVLEVIGLIENNQAERISKHLKDLYRTQFTKNKIIEKYTSLILREAK